MRVAVTGAHGRLGRAVVAALADAPFTGPAGPIAWDRAELDLDDASAVVGPLLDRDRPEVIVHTAAWTDVDGCAREPDVAMRRNGTATGQLAQACAAQGIDLIAISTNEVFAGDRDDGRGYAPDDPAQPPNAYGRSKLAGERAAAEAYGRDGSRGVLGIVRTSWLYGPPGNDFPTKILAAAERAIDTGEALRVVGDEFGSPTFTHDVAEAIVDLLAENAVDGAHHVVDSGIASRADWARELFRQLRVDVPIDEVPASTWQRASTPPRWGVLAPTPLPAGPLRPWQDALADYVPVLRRKRAAPVR